MLDETTNGAGVEDNEAAPPATGAEITVLVVDDESGNVTSLEKIFQRENMRTFTAENARAALDIVRRHRVQVVLSDLMMPGTTGLELLRALKRSRRTPKWC